MPDSPKPRSAPTLLPALASGGAIGFVTPASAVAREAVDPGLRLLTDHGYRIVTAPHAFDTNGITAAPEADRLADIHGFLDDPEIGAIWALRGGYGTMQLLEGLDYDRFAARPRLLVGFSDVTALQWGMFTRIALPTLSGLAVTLQVRADNPYWPLSHDILTGRRTAIDDTALVGERLGVRQPGTAEGWLLGGTLSMICALAGTPFFPDTDAIILFIEDIEEPLYRIDRCLRQLALMNFWKRVRGVVLGRFLWEGRALDAYPLLAPLIGPDIPVLDGMPYGHFAHSLPLPSGVPAVLSTAPARLEWAPFLTVA